MELKLDTRTVAWVENRLADAGQLLRGSVADRGAWPWQAASIDTRADCAGRIFFALKGERTNGHRFVEEALGSGSPLVVVDDKSTADRLEQSNAPYLLVSDSLRALQELAGAYRASVGFRVVAVTGSAGKTTTKQFIHLILKSKYRAHCGQGNFNNHIGVPLTILETAPDNEYLVAEVAANHVGEIDFLSRLLRPDVGAITNIGDAHIGLFGSRDKIAEAKAELFAGIDPEGAVALPGDDDYIGVLESWCRCRMVTFGHRPTNTYRISKVARNRDRIEFAINGVPFTMRSFGLYNALNAGAACAVGELCGVDLTTMSDILTGFEPSPGRARRYESGGIVLIDDSYNANPRSMTAALEALATEPARRRIAVLGDMGELGAYAEASHGDLGRVISHLGIDHVRWVGERGSDVLSGLRQESGKPILEQVRDVDELIAGFNLTLVPGDVVLVKASRVVMLDRFVDHLRRSLFDLSEKGE